MNYFESFKFVDTDNKFHNTNFLLSNGESSSYQIILLCALHSEVWSCVRMGKPRKSTFLDQRDLGVCDSIDPSSFPHFDSFNCQDF